MLLESSWVAGDAVRIKHHLFLLSVGRRGPCPLSQWSTSAYSMRPAGTNLTAVLFNLPPWLRCQSARLWSVDLAVHSLKERNSLLPCRRDAKISSVVVFFVFRKNTVCFFLQICLLWADLRHITLLESKKTCVQPFSLSRVCKQLALAKWATDWPVWHLNVRSPKAPR